VGYADAPAEVRSIVVRSDSFLRLLRRLAIDGSFKARHPRPVDRPSWYIAQRFLWLVTQPYRDGSLVSDLPWLDFTHSRDGGSQSRPNRLLTRLSSTFLSAMDDEGIGVHPANTRLLEEIRSHLR
jgi:hypothetical protein